MPDTDSGSTRSFVKALSSAEVGAALLTLEDNSATAVRKRGRSRVPGPVAALAERVEANRAALGEGDDWRLLTFGRYSLERELGRGAYGVVFASFDLELEREVALKVFHVPTSEQRERVLHEARALAKLSHPNVVALHDLGYVDEFAYLVMDFVDGWTMQERMRMSIGWRAMVWLFIQAGRGLAAAHEAGLEHGDVKPGNILVGRDGRVQVADFGLARTLVETARSQPSWHAGTHGYRAPEWLFEGCGDARSDQFSFCVSLWQALYGRRPWGGCGFEYEAMFAGVVEPAKRGSAVGIPVGVERVLRRGLAADPGDRFAGMGELVSALATAVTEAERGRRSGWRGKVIEAVSSLPVWLLRSVRSRAWWFTAWCGRRKRGSR